VEEIIKISNLNFTYPDGKQVLNDINLNIYENESVGIIGPNGAGKTTLLLHLLGILRGEGEINVLGMSMNDGNLKKIRNKIGLVFQDPNDQLFTPTVFDDVAFGPLNLGISKDIIEQKVKESLNKVGMSGFEERFPHHLSFGEKKRISIATVLAMEVEILLLDEPSSNLDPKARRQLINLLNNLKITKIIAANDLKLASEVCKRVILLDEGKIVAGGDTEDILNNKSLMERYGFD